MEDVDADQVEMVAAAANISAQEHNINDDNNNYSNNREL